MSNGQTNGDAFRRKQENIQSWVRLLFRDVAAPLMGIVILSYETVIEKADRPWLIIAALTLLGYPFADRVDKWLKGLPVGKGDDGK